MWLGFCVLFFCILFPGSVVLLARVRDTNCVKSFWNEWAAALPDILAECGSWTPNLEAISEDSDFAAWDFFPWDRERSCCYLKYGSLPCSYQGIPSEVYHFKGNRILILWDCTCKYLMEKANQTCSPSCLCSLFFQKALYALIHHSAHDWGSSSSWTLEQVKSVHEYNSVHLLVS